MRFGISIVMPGMYVSSSSAMSSAMINGTHSLINSCILQPVIDTHVNIIEPNGATIVGHWPTAGYHFEASKGLADDDHFVGLAIDEDRQPELTAERVEKWVKQVSEELHLDEIKNA